jgi:hypothetical protein
MINNGQETATLPEYFLNHSHKTLPSFSIFGL